MANKHTKYNKTVKGRYRSLKTAAKAKGAFNISFWEYVQILSAPCYYCGTENKGSSGTGVDRINSNKGYTLKNVRSCCPTCNTMKNNLTETQFYKHLALIIKHLKL